MAWAGPEFGRSPFRERAGMQAGRLRYVRIAKAQNLPPSVGKCRLLSPSVGPPPTPSTETLSANEHFFI